jgi:hypothetical protein
LPISWCADDRCDMVGNNEDRGRSRRHSTEERGWSSTSRVLGGEETRDADFLVWPQNQGRWFASGLASKPLGQGSLFEPQNQQLRFGSLGLKITAMVSWFGLKTKRAMVYRLRHKTNGRMKTAQGTHRDLVACFTWKQVRLGFPILP